MRELLAPLRACTDATPAALATVVATFRSAPRPAGAAMLVTADGAAHGSVSGGCVESAVYQLGLEVLQHGNAQLQRYGVSDDDALAVGLTCGGILDIFVERIDSLAAQQFHAVREAIDSAQPISVATVLTHPNTDLIGERLLIGPTELHGSTGSMRLDDAITDDARGALALGHSTTLHYGPDGQRRGEGTSVFVSVFAPPPRMLVFGAIDFAAAMAKMGSFLGYRVTVCDARAVFATASRFPHAAEVIVDWPHRYLRKEIEHHRVDGRTVAAVLTHDPKFDVPLLEVALRAELGYVGAMGSRRTHLDRLDRLRHKGFTETELQKLCSPIGLDLGGRTPEETAVSIAAEMVATRWGGQGQSLSDMDGPIHLTPMTTR